MRRSHLKTLCEEAKVDFDENLTKAQASKRIDELQAQTGRGQHGKPSHDATDQVEETTQSSGFTGS